MAIGLAFFPVVAINQIFPHAVAKLRFFNYELRIKNYELFLCKMLDVE